MPTYEYQCSTCGHRFEKFQSFSEDPVKECPVCGQSVKKLISSSGIIFKGSGWYINDSKKSSPAATTAAGKEETKPATAEDSGPSKDGAESKPAAATSDAPAAETKSAGKKNEAAA